MALQKNIARITKRTVDAMPLPVKGKARLWDSELKGFCVCAYPTGRKVYVIGYRDRSTRFRWFTIGKRGDPWTAEAARIKARELLGNVTTGDFPDEKKVRERLDSTTVAELVERYHTEGPMDELERSGVINPLHADCLRLIAYSATRKGEIMGLRWAEVDADNQRLLLPPARHKTGGANLPRLPKCLVRLKHQRKLVGFKKAF